MSGEIHAGDYDKLLSSIKANPGSYLAAYSFEVNSLGGNVEDAIKIARLVELYRYSVVVGPNDVCASACFLIVAAGSYRALAGKVIIHRIYIPKSEYADMSVDAITDATRKWSDLATTFLHSYQVPDSIIEIMLHTPSSSGHVLTTMERYSLSGFSPSWEEVMIQACGTSNAEYLRADDAKQQSVMKCEGDVQFQARSKELTKLVGEENLRAGWRTLLEQQGYQQNADGTLSRRDASPKPLTTWKAHAAAPVKDDPKLLNSQAWMKWTAIARAKGIPVNDPGTGIGQFMTLFNEVLPALARSGNIEASMALAQFFYEGKDYTSSLPIYLHAAEAGDVRAMEMLVLQYMEGQGTTKDLVRAYAWGRIAFAYDPKRDPEFIDAVIAAFAGPGDIRTFIAQGNALTEKLKTTILAPQPSTTPPMTQNTKQP
ncbi:MAG: hypothetical protein ACYC9L_06175 [Sulfuricaulis sp.]